ncbi:hypothetical protein AWN76_013935 [Rhodothermaceae bacterium RA]|nr:hypothetical protein AWN76_013935 [Rhodothermaceae bacterium RA]
MRSPCFSTSSWPADVHRSGCFMHRLRAIVPLLLLLLSLPAAGTPADGPQRFIVQPGSRFWIRGSSTVNRFTCEAAEVVGYGVLEASPAGARTVQEGGAGTVQVHVSVPVQAFDCGNRRMNRDMYEALKAQAHPVIQYELLQADVLSADEDGWHTVQVRGRLTIAGTERIVETRVQARREPDGRVRAVGSMALRMTDFNVEPPTAMMGVIKAHDDITVHFELIAAATAS